MDTDDLCAIVEDGLRAAEMSYRGLSGILKGAIGAVPLQSQTRIRVKVGSTETADRKAALNGMGPLWSL